MGRAFVRADGTWDWPNDESFVATFLTQAGSVCLDLNQCGAAVYGDATFSWRERPHSRRELEASPRDGQVYHPVSQGTDYLIAMRRALDMQAGLATMPHTLAFNFGGDGLRWLVTECGFDAARHFESEIEASLRARMALPGSV